MKASYKTGEDVDRDETLWRLIRPDWVIADDNLGRMRPSSAAFKDGSKQMSVDIKNLTNMAKSLEGRPLYSIAQFETEFCKQLCLEVKADPCPPENPTNDAHALVNGKVNGSMANKFAKQDNIWAFLHPDSNKSIPHKQN